MTAYTSINFAYLDRALVLADSLRAHHPEWHLVLVLVEPAVPTDSLSEALSAFDEVILAAETVRSGVRGMDIRPECRGGVHRR